MHKIINIEERIPTLKNRREKKKNTRFILLLVILGILLLFLLYFQLPISHINKIKVTGGKVETQEYYIKHSGIAEGEALWNFNNEEVTSNIKKLDTVKSVTVKRVWLNDVKIHVVENKKVALLKTQDRYNIVLENGKVLPNRNKVTDFSMPILLNMLDEEFRLNLIQQLNDLKPNILSMISQVEYAPTKANANLVQIYMNDGFEVKADITNLASKLQYYPSIVTQLDKDKKGVINLEIGGYYNSFKLEYK